MTCETCDANGSCANCQALGDLYETDTPIMPDEINQHASTLAVKQSHDAGEMTADFIIVSRQDNEPNLNGNLVQIGKSKFGMGIDLSYHEIARPVLLEHGFDMPFPIGTSEDSRGRHSVRRQGKTMLGTVRFSQALPEAELVFAMVEEGTLRMASVSYRIMKAMVLKQKAHGTLPAGVEDWSHFRRGHDFVETLLLEWSIVHSGADRGSIRQALERGRVGTAKIPDTMKRYLTRHAEERQAQGVGTDFTPHPPGLNIKLPDTVPYEAATRKLQSIVDGWAGEIPQDSANAVDTNAANHSDRAQPGEIDTQIIGQALADSVLKDGSRFSDIGNEIANSL